MRTQRVLVTIALVALAAVAGPAASADRTARHGAAAQMRGIDDPRAFVAQMYDAYVHGGEDRPPPDPAYAYSPRLAALFAAYQRWQDAHPDTVGAIQAALTENFAKDYDRIIGAARKALTARRQGDFRIAATISEVHHGRILVTGRGLFLSVEARGSAEILYRRRG